MKDNISIQEKQSIVSLLSTILILGLYSLYTYNKYVAANPDIINEPKFWGKAFLILIPVTIVAQIIIHIVFAIVAKIVFNEDIPDFSDERDKLIELKSSRVSHWLFISGFFLSMGSLVLEMPLWVMFVVLISSGFMAAIAGEIVKLYMYRKGC